MKAVSLTTSAGKHRIVMIALVGCLVGGQALSGQQTDAAADKEAALELVNLDLLDSRGGYAIPRESEFLPGETVNTFFQIQNYKVGLDYRIHLRYQIEAFDPDGRRFHPSEGGEFAVELAPQDENWRPSVHYTPRLPTHAVGGEYAVHIEVNDLLANTTVRAKLPINVDAQRVESNGEFLIRNLQIFRGADTEPLDRAVFMPGESIRAAFMITGYAFDGGSDYDVESSAWVLDGDGERMFSIEAESVRHDDLVPVYHSRRRVDAASPFGSGSRDVQGLGVAVLKDALPAMQLRALSDELDYPRLWLPARLTLELDPTIPSGQYTLVLDLRDNVGKAQTQRQVELIVR